ncbi:3-ketoacyl-acyl carrier protein reductase [Echria macrotheca]|uniref:3-ketoacyl-acyl carrier protein reductase n=1 Tax=Echria macrotheca TaxID=438768 RepID=A0AAJ0B9Q6_9PEZI|nr:3-ketoacyl-acyl carrier protein reductase [Echria macrotheca]
MSDLQGKVAIVTGASRGLGVGMALELARNGASVMLTYTSDSSSSKVEQLVSQISQLPGNPSARGCKVDLSSIDGPQIVLAELEAWLGADSRIHILVNNAGTEVVRPLADVTVADYEKVYNLNVRGPLLLTQALLPRFSESNNRIINIGSVGGRAGFKALSLYCSSKAALEGFTRCWAHELGGNGTTVNQVNPGPVQTDMLDNIPKGIVEMQKQQTPVENRVGTVDEIAKIVAWLASPSSSWISGQVISASGGWAMY